MSTGASSEWLTEQHEELLRLGLRSTATLYEGRSEYQAIAVHDTALLGKVLLLDGVFQTSVGDEFVYHEMMVHPALVLAARTARVLVVGGGDGGTVREVLRHATVERVEMVEIDAQVVEVARRFLPEIGTAWNDPRLELRIADGVGHVHAAAPASYDAILVDCSDPEGPAAGLFGPDFYAAAQRALAPGGVFAMQSESPQLTPRLYTEIQAAMRAAFRDVRPCFAPVLLYGAAVWSWTLAGEALACDAPHLARIATFADDLRYYNPEVHRAAFARPNYVRRLDAGARPGATETAPR